LEGKHENTGKPRTERAAVKFLIFTISA
jgi:hypothetical protein